MTPDEARALLDGTTPGPWEVDHDHAWEPGVWSPDSIIFGPYYDRQDVEQWEAGTPEDLRLAAAAPALATMLAGMREEWGVEATHYRDGDLHTRWGYTDRQDAAAFARYMGKDPRWNAARVVRRYVTLEEEIS